jgi:hypothetical protein
MKKFLAKAGLLSLTASALISSANAYTAPSGAVLIDTAIDLTNYDKLKVVFNAPLTSNDQTVFQNLINDTNITINNSATDDEVNVSIERNISNVMYFNIDSNAINIIRGNTYNELNITVVDGTQGSGTMNATTTIGTLDVTDDAWNLITIPDGLHTNAREFIKANKVTMIWGWEYNSTSTDYDWEAYPSRMEAGRGYWVRTRVAGNTASSLGDIVSSDYNATVFGDYDGSEINTTNFAEIVSTVPKKDKWVLLGNSGAEANITSSANGNSERNVSQYFFEDLLNATESCYFVSVYHWDASGSQWINDTVNGATSTPIPSGAGVWVKQRLCNN